MVIHGYNKIAKFAKKHADAAPALEAWRKHVNNAQWQTFHDIKNDFNSVDQIGNDRCIFNIKGNNYRMVVIVRFTLNTIFVRFIGTHAQYDKINCNTI
jgi:mRNA interferase HigB